MTTPTRNVATRMTQPLISRLPDGPSLSQMIRPLRRARDLEDADINSIVRATPSRLRRHRASTRRPGLTPHGQAPSSRYPFGLGALLFADAEFFPPTIEVHHAGDEAP